MRDLPHAAQDRHGLATHKESLFFNVLIIWVSDTDSIIKVVFGEKRHFPKSRTQEASAKIAALGEKYSA